MYLGEISDICSGYISAYDHRIFKILVSKDKKMYDLMIESWFIVWTNFARLTKGPLLWDTLYASPLGRGEPFCQPHILNRHTQHE